MYELKEDRKFIDYELKSDKPTPGIYTKYGFHRFKVGQYIELETLTELRRAATAAGNFVRRHAPGWRFSQRKTREGFFLWRVM